MLARSKPIRQAARPVRCKAKGCDQRFLRRAAWQKACSPDCAQAIVAADKARAAERAARIEKAMTRKAKEEAKSRNVLQAEAQDAFNWYIRMRDARLPCVSCGCWTSLQWDAGHYRSVGSTPELRFDEANCHKQCVVCNRDLHGNLIEYRLALVLRIGEAEVERLEGANPLLHLANDELRALRDTYRARARQLEKAQGFSV